MVHIVAKRWPNLGLQLDRRNQVAFINNDEVPFFGGSVVAWEFDIAPSGDGLFCEAGVQEHLSNHVADRVQVGAPGDRSAQARISLTLGCLLGCLRLVDAPIRSNSLLERLLMHVRSTKDDQYRTRASLPVWPYQHLFR
jgi:hypothetical protein